MMKSLKVMLHAMHVLLILSLFIIWSIRSDGFLPLADRSSCCRAPCRLMTFVGTEALSKVYQPQFFFQSEKEALINITLSFSHDKPLLTFIGPSNSGKTTLAKCITGAESISSGFILATSGCSSSTIIRSSTGYINSGYVDHLYRSTYDEQLTIEQLLLSSSSKLSADLRLLFEELMGSFGLNKSIPVKRLLNSQRMSFEWLLEMSRIYSRITMPGDAADVTADELPSCLIVLDEYLDKETSAVCESVAKNMRIAAAHPQLRTQFITITHSKKVLRICTDHAVVLHYGKVYSTGGPQQVVTPSKMTWLP